MKCLFFGAGGYLGRNLVSQLRQNGNEVVIPSAPDGGRLDLIKIESYVNIDWNVDVVFLFAGITGTTTAFDNYEKFIAGNELVLLHILDSIRRSSSRPRVIFPSTRLIYGGSDNPLHENGAQKFKTLYGVNKIACEHYLNVYANAFDIPYTVLRVCVPYASNVGNNYSFGTIGNFISQARSAKRICLYGGGTVKRTLTHIDDLCRIISLTAGHSETTNRTYNVPGENMSLYEAASLVAAKYGACVESVDWPEFDARIESGSTVFDGSLLLDTLQTAVEYRFSEWVTDAKVV